MTELRVQPLGWETSPEFIRMPVSPIGHVMPKIYVLVSEVFPLADASQADAIVKNMEAGLAFALSQFSVLAGNLEVDEESGKLWASKKRDAAVSLHVKHFGEDFPSYHELEEKDFPANMLVGHKLLPSSVTAKQLYSPLGNNNEKGLPLAVFQLNFIRGGFVLGLAIHHTLSDGPGCDGFLTTWAENSRAARDGRPFVPNEHAFDMTVTGPPLYVDTPVPERIAAIRDAYPMIGDAGGPPPLPPPGFQMPALRQQMWHFPQSKLRLLKDMAAGKDSQTDWISTYDAVMAFIWGRVTDARIIDAENQHFPVPSTTASLVHAINSRKLWNPPLSDRDLNGAAVPGQVPPRSLEELRKADPATLQTLAAAVRTSTRKLTADPTYLSGMLEWIVGQPDQRYLEVVVHLFSGMDTGASSWQAMTAYTQHDFGFGVPRAVRWPSPVFMNFVFFYPSRAMFKDAEADEGLEVCVCVTESVHQVMAEDKTLLNFAEMRDSR